jgi:hypothetical protein
MPREAVLACSESTRLIVRADAQRLGLKMTKLADEYIQTGRKFYPKSCASASKSKSKTKTMKQKQEVANG